jgi:hypothetical protein
LFGAVGTFVGMVQRLVWCCREQRCRNVAKTFLVLSMVRSARLLTLVLQKRTVRAILPAVEVRSAPLLRTIVSKEKRGKIFKKLVVMIETKDELIK